MGDEYARVGEAKNQKKNLQFKVLPYGELVLKINTHSTKFT